MQIDTLDNMNHAIALEIFAVMQEAYTQEANLLGIDEFPPLGITTSEIKNEQGIYYGTYIEQELAGVLHFVDINIDSLVVKPTYQRQGVATRLLHHLIAVPSMKKVTVSTARENLPAVTLYKNFGFEQVSDYLVDGLLLVNFEKVIPPMQ